MRSTRSSITRSGDHVENLFLLDGSRAIDGIGNDLENVMIGNARQQLSSEGGTTYCKAAGAMTSSPAAPTTMTSAFSTATGSIGADFVAGDRRRRCHRPVRLRSWKPRRAAALHEPEGGDVVIQFDEQNQITLANVSLGSLNQGDFLLRHIASGTARRRRPEDAHRHSGIAQWPNIVDWMERSATSITGKPPAARQRTVRR